MRNQPPVTDRRAVLVILIARAAITAVTALVVFALTLRVHDSGQGPVAVAVLMAAFALPSIFGMGLAGYVADRYPLRALVTTTAVVQMAAVAALTLTHSTAGMLALVALVQTAQTLAVPTWQALLPAVAGEAAYARTAAHQQAALSLTGIASAGAAGAIVAVWSGTVVLWAAAASAGVLLVCGLAMPAAPGGGPEAHPPTLSELWAPRGVDLLRRDELVWPLLLASMLAVLVVESVNVAEVFLVRDALHGSAAAFGVAQGVSAAGAVLGAWAAGRLRTQHQRFRAAAASMAASGVAMAASGAAPNILALCALFGAAGFTFTLSGSCFFPALMLRTTPQHRAAVNAAAVGLGRAASLVGLAVGAVAGTLLGPRATFAAAGALVAAVCVLASVRVWRSTSGEAPDAVTAAAGEPSRPA